MKNYTNTMLCWNPGGEVALVPWPGEGRGRQYMMSCGACMFDVQKKNFEQRKAIAFIDAITLIVRDKCDPKKVHDAMLGLEEYIDGLPTDMLAGDLLLKRLAEEGEVNL